MIPVRKVKRGKNFFEKGDCQKEIWNKTYLKDDDQ